MAGIRPVEQSEREPWEQMFSAYAEFYKTTLPDGAAERAWSWIHDASEAFWCDVAFQDDRLIGFTQYQLMHRSLSGERVCYLSDLYVDPELRGAGTGRALIDNVFKFARSKGIPNVRWLTQEFNYPARALYDSFGTKSDFILYSFAVDR